MARQVVVAGVGMVPFSKPGAGPDYSVMGPEAVRAALADAGLDYSDIGQAYAGYVYGDSCSGQRVLYSVGMSGVPIVNVNNNCSTGSTALYLARQAVEHGIVDCALAVGFEQMRPGALGDVFTDRPSPSTRSTARPMRLSGMAKCRLRSASSAAPGSPTCGSTARSSRPSPRSAPRRRGTR